MLKNPPALIHTHQLNNGLTVIVQQMPSVQSAAYSLMVPAGCMYDRSGRNGTASVLCEMLPRGAGERNSRELSSAQDFLGLHSRESVNVAHMKFSGAVLKDNLSKSLEILSDIVLRPHLDEIQFAPSQNSVLQSLRSLEDEPRQKVMIELRRRCLGLPFGLPVDGTPEEVRSLTYEDVRQQYKSCFRPEESILGIAGNVNPHQIVEEAESLFGDWKPGSPSELQSAPPGPARDHISLESQQTQIGLAYPSVSAVDPDYYTAWAAVSILSGGSSSRLFTEVREKRGLCYAVYASLSSMKQNGHVLCYAGTMTERAQETLDVMLQEIRRLSQNITPEELERCKAGAKSALIIQEETSIARAGRIARDWYLRGRVISLDEIHERLDELTPQGIAEFVEAHPAQNLTLLTIGPKPLEISNGV